MLRAIPLLSVLALLLSSPSQAALVSAAPAPLPPATSENASTAFLNDGSESRIGLLCHNDPVNKTDPTGLDPGDPFTTIEGAVRDVHSFINPTSISQNRRYGSVIYQGANGKFYASTPFTNNAEGHVKVGGPTDNSRLPDGGHRAGDYHTHGDYSKKITNPTNGRSAIVRTSKSEDPKSDHPSEPDQSRAGSIQKTNPEYRFFLGTPSKELKEYDSKKEKPL